MKKFIIILLLILPIFLMVTISIAGRIFSYLTYISVERVEIVDVDNNPIETLTISKGEEITLNVKIYPELANNKQLTYISLDTTIVEVDSNGVVKGVDYGYTEVIVKSLDTDVTDKIGVVVDASEVESVDIKTKQGQSIEEIEINLYASMELTAIVYPIQLPSEKKNITWSTSDSTYVDVDQNGKITAKKVTEENQFITITVTTENGNKIDSCKVKVLSYTLAFKPKVMDGTDEYETDQESLNLKDFILYDETKISIDDILFKIVSGNNVLATLNGDVLTFLKGNRNVKVRAYDKNGSVEPIEFIVRYLGNKS